MWRKPLDSGPKSRVYDEGEMAGLTIGKVAERAGVNIDTLRYYERQAVIPPPERNGSNYRIYSQDTVPRVRFVKRAQELGFTLAEIKELPPSIPAAPGCRRPRKPDHTFGKRATNVNFGGLPLPCL